MNTLAKWQITGIADQIEQEIQYNDVTYDNPVIIDGVEKYGYQLKPDTLKFLEKTVKQLRDLYAIVHEYDLMLSDEQ